MSARERFPADATGPFASSLLPSYSDFGADNWYSEVFKDAESDSEVRIRLSHILNGEFHSFSRAPNIFAKLEIVL